MGTEQGTERKAVKTYVPAYQKAEWEAHAADLDMSQSEFVRTMVQAGRREFDPDPVETEESGTDPGGQDVHERVLGILEERGALSWDELVSALTEDVEERVDEALDRLQTEDRVRHSGRAGGYVVTGDR